MKSKLIIRILMFLISFSASCQVSKSISFKSIEKNLTDFLIEKGSIMEHNVNDFRSGKHHINFSGVLNGYSKDDLINGIYVFSSGFSHSKVFYFIIENENFIILDISSKEGLNSALISTTDFCERQKYCSEITIEYTSRILGAYYVINKNPINRRDIYCIKSKNKVKDLP